MMNVKSESFSVPIKVRHRSAEVNRRESSLTEVTTIWRRSHRLIFTSTLGETQADIRVKTYNLLYESKKSAKSIRTSEGSN